jgi:ABC-2 type transport system ATP-binding protein
MIHCENVVKRFGDKTVLSGINIDIPKGKIFGLLGPSGAGKTTLIKILTGQLEYDRGRVRTMGKDVKNLTGEDKKKIGIMMDQFGVYERLSCYDNLKIFANLYKIPASRIYENLELVGLGDAAKKSAFDLSKGMRVRLQLARVFMLSPQILFLDEPTTGLDPMTQKKIHNIILSKKKAGCTIFLTTHNMEEAAKLCDTVALLNDGVIVDSGTPEGICRKYNHQKRISLNLKSGENLELAHGKESADAIRMLLMRDEIVTIHSSEPTLESVFLELTGRKLEEEV